MVRAEADCSRTTLAIHEDSPEHPRSLWVVCAYSRCSRQSAPPSLSWWAIVLGLRSLGESQCRFHVIGGNTICVVCLIGGVDIASSPNCVPHHSPRGENLTLVLESGADNFTSLLRRPMEDTNSVGLLQLVLVVNQNLACWFYLNLSKSLIWFCSIQSGDGGTPGVIALLGGIAEDSVAATSWAMLCPTCSHPLPQHPFVRTPLWPLLCLLAPCSPLFVPS